MPTLDASEVLRMDWLLLIGALVLLFLMANGGDRWIDERMQRRADRRRLHREAKADPQTGPITRQRSTPSRIGARMIFDKMVQAVGSTFMVALAFAWTFGGVIGAIYWAIDGDLLNVVLSIFIPLYGAVTVLVDLIG